MTKWYPGALNIIKILCTLVKNQGFAMFSSSRLRSSIGDPFGLHFGSLLASRWLQHGFQSSQDGSKTTQGASKTPLIRLQDRPRTSQDAFRTAPSAPKAPPRLSKSLQDGSGSLQDPSKSSPGEVLETPSRLQELSRRGFGDSKPRPRALPKSRPSLQLLPCTR